MGGSEVMVLSLLLFLKEGFMESLKGNGLFMYQPCAVLAFGVGRHPPSQKPALDLMPIRH